jgi:hypothetical protein
MSLSKQIGPEFEAFDFTHDQRTYEVFRGGSGPAVLVLHEIPGLHPTAPALSSGGCGHSPRRPTVSVAGPGLAWSGCASPEVSRWRQLSSRRSSRLS